MATSIPSAEAWLIQRRRRSADLGTFAIALTAMMTVMIVVLLIAAATGAPTAAIGEALQIGP